MECAGRGVSGLMRALAKQKQTPTPHWLPLRAGQIRLGRDPEEQDEKVEECAEEALFVFCGQVRINLGEWIRNGLRAHFIRAAKGPGGCTIFLSYVLPGKQLCRAGYGLDAGLAAGLGFLAGLETPKLISRTPNPLRSKSSTLIVSVPSQPSPPISNLVAVAGRLFPAYFFWAGDAVAFLTAGAGGFWAGGAGGGSPRRIATAASGSGLSALASSRLTCHIPVSVSTPL